MLWCWARCALGRTGARSDGAGLAHRLVTASAGSGRLIVHVILHAIGEEERYDIALPADGLTLTATDVEYADRGNVRRAGATLRMAATVRPLRSP